MIARPWTDDLPKCRQTSIGQRISRVGRGVDSNGDDYLCFYCQLEGDTSVYGVFEPHNGTEAARFVMQRMAAELLFQTISPTSTDEEIRDMLRNAFAAVEKAYVENYDGMIAERTSLQYQLQNLNETQSSGDYEAILSRLKAIDQTLSSGAGAALALVAAGRLFVASVGEPRAALCRTDENSVLRVLQLSAEHSLASAEERARLRALGLDAARMRNARPLGNQSGTRCLGNYLVKGLYRAFPDLRAASAEPVTAEPDIQGPITLDASCRFLILVSSGVCKRIQEVKGSPELTNKQLAQIIVENFRKQPDFHQLSDAVLNEVEDEFQSYCVKNNLTPKASYMTLLVRNFNFPTQVDDKAKPNVRFNPIVESKSTCSLAGVDTESISSAVDTNRSGDSNSDIYPPGRPYDKNRRIKGYVDFSCYYENVEKARRNGTAQFH